MDRFYALVFLASLKPPKARTLARATSTNTPS